MEQFGHYRLQRLIGSGPTGEVHRALDTRRDRLVALKVLPELLSGDEEYQRWFRHQADAVARLREPHVLAIHGCGEVGGRLYLDMHLVEGGSLQQVLAGHGPLSPTHAVDLVGQVAAALDAAHAEGIPHLGVQPSNVLVDDVGFVHVTDFGLARAAGPRPEAGAPLGLAHVHHAAPEQVDARPVDARADVYSLACVLVECLIGGPPFPGDDPDALVHAHLHLPPPRVSDRVEGVPGGLDEVIARGMAKVPDDRFPTAGGFAAAARAALGVPPFPITVPGTGRAGAGGRDGARNDRDGPDAAEHAGDGEHARGAGHAGDGGVPGGRSGGAVTGSPGPGSADAPSPADAPYLAGGPAPPPGPLGGGASDRWLSRRGRRLIAVLVALLLVVATAGVTVRVTRGPGPVERGASASPGVPPAPGDPAPPGAGAGPVGASVAVPTVAGTVAVGATPGHVQVAPDGRYAYIAHRDAGVLTVFDTTANAVTGTIPVPDGGPQFVAFSPDGTRAYVSIVNTERTINQVGVLDTATSTFIARVPTEVRPFALDVTPDGATVYVPNRDTGSITVIDAATSTVRNTISVAPNPHRVEVSADGTRLYAANYESNLLTVIDTATERPIATVPVGRSPHSLTAHPTEPLLFHVDFDSSSLWVTDLETNQVLTTVPTAAHPQDVTLAPDGRHGYLATVDDNAVQVFDTETFEITARVPTGRSPTSVAMSPNGRQAYVTNLSDGTLTILNTAGLA